MSLNTEELNTIEKYNDEQRLSYLLQQVVSTKTVWIFSR